MSAVELETRLGSVSRWPKQCLVIVFRIVCHEPYKPTILPSRRLSAWMLICSSVRLSATRLPSGYQPQDVLSWLYRGGASPPFPYVATLWIKLSRFLRVSSIRRLPTSSLLFYDHTQWPKEQHRSLLVPGCQPVGMALVPGCQPMYTVSGPPHPHPYRTHPFGT